MLHVRALAPWGGWGGAKRDRLTTDRQRRRHEGHSISIMGASDFLACVRKQIPPICTPEKEWGIPCQVAYRVSTVPLFVDDFSTWGMKRVLPHGRRGVGGGLV